MVISSHWHLLASTCLAAALVAVPAIAADAPAADDGEIVVTGSLFSRSKTEGASPLTVLSSEQLARQGLTNIADAVRSISADNSGSIPTAFTGGFGAGAAAVSLRGLTVNSTLTLIDGLRSANYPLADDGQRAFVDLNTIPDAAIDRIEVLKDGASATYGADAIGGVVNIILKKEFSGVEALAEGGITDRGDGDEQRIQATLGYGKLSTQGFNIYISGEYQRNARILARDRGFPFNTADLTSIGGDNNNAGSSVPGSTRAAIVAPTSFTNANDILSGTGLTFGPFRVLNPAGCTAGLKPVSGDAGNGCEQNLVSDYGQIQPQQERFGVTVHAAVDLNPTTQAYVVVSFNQSNVTALASPANIRSVNPINAQNIFLPALLSNGQPNPNNPYAADGQPAAIRYLFGDIPSGSSYRSHVLRAAAGVAGSFGDSWTWSVDVAAVHNWLDITNTGYINVAGLTAAIKDGTYNFVNPELNSAAIRAQVSPDTFASPSSDLDMIQGHISRDLFNLPGGAVKLGVGGSLRYEKVNNPNQNIGNLTFGLNAVSAVGSRTVTSGFFEIDAPVLKSLDINVAGRFDHYSQGYDRFSPKVGIKFTPIDMLSVRGTFSKGFRAPSFSETSGSVIGFTTTRIPCSAQAAHGATVDGDNCSGGSSYNQSYAIGFNTAGTPGIRPETSTSFTGGVVLDPAPWLKLTVDYYNIKKSQIISGGPLAGQAIDAYYAGTALPAGYSVTLDSVDPQFPAAIRRILFVNAPYANASALRTSGLDFAATANFTIRDKIRVSSRLEATDILEYKFKTDDASPYQSYVGTQAPYITSSGAGTPRWRGTWSTSAQYDRATLTATVNYVDGYKAVAIDQFGGNDCATSTTYQGSNPNFNCFVGSFTTVDLVGTFDVSPKWTVYFNVVNLGDTRAPLNGGNYAANNYNPTFTQAGAVGRLIRIGARIRY